MELGQGDYAKYPFLPESGELVRIQEMTLYDLVESENSKVLERAKERIIEAAKRQQVSDKSHDYNVELLSFPVALMLVKAIGIEHFVQRYSLAEAIRAENLLEKEGKKDLVTFIFEKLLQIPLRTVHLQVGVRLYEFTIPVIEYLKRSTQIHGDRWKLVNRHVEKGFVYLTTLDLIRLIREEVSAMINSKINSLAIPKLPEKIHSVIEEVSMFIPAKRVSDVDFVPLKYPPCVEKSLELLKTGKNVPHFGRFLMATYLLGAGKTVDEIVSLYPRVPDFNERITKYQVEHLAGLRGGRVRYKVPKCKTLQMYNFCFKTEECGNIKTPIQFGRFAVKKRGGNKSARQYKKSASETV